MSPLVHDLTARRLDAALAAEQAAARVPSLVAAVVRDGELVWSGTRGQVVSVGEPDLLPTIDVQYRIGSITKIMTAVLVMQLRDDGRLRLTDRLGDHLPGAPYGGRTLRELLSHSGGLPAEPPGPWWERSPGVTLETLLASLDEADAPFDPGREYHYSNLAYALLGALVAEVSGEPWAECLQRRVLGPLGMRRTSYLPLPPAATGYSVDTFSGEVTREPAHDAGAMAPAGQLWSTVADLARLAAFLIAPDESVLAAETLAEMTAAQTGSPDAAAAGGYGLGLRLAVVGDRSYLGHTGSVPGFVAGLFVDRGHRAAGLAVANGATGLRTQAFPVDLLRLLQDLEPSIPPAWIPTATVPDELRELLGLWYWGNLAFTFGLESERLVARSLAGNAVWFTVSRSDAGHLVGSSGYFAGERLRPVRRPDGGVSHLECATFVFTRVPYDPSAPIPGGPPEPIRSGWV